MERNPGAYLARDRLEALAAGRELPARAEGSVLFVDLVGFTPMTEGLHRSLGPRLGAEELTRRLDLLFTALCVAIDAEGGSVIGFAGDAVTAWFDSRGRGAGKAAKAAVACAASMLASLGELRAGFGLGEGEAPPALRVSVASGEAQRLTAGDPGHQILDLMGGPPFDRVARGEELVEAGDLVVDTKTLGLLGGSIADRSSELRHPETGDRYFVIPPALAAPSLLRRLAGSLPLPLFGRRAAGAPLPSPADPEILRPWIHPAVWKREMEGLGDFSSEFRPCAVLFVRFAGLGREEGDRELLSARVRFLQEAARRQEGELLQVTIGDKGAYAYLTFGALQAHEDDSRRAARAALEIAAAGPARGFAERPGCGLSRGLLYVGAYGAPGRRVFSAIGDDVNLAARLMQRAAGGSILVSGRVLFAIRGDFAFSEPEAMELKGKSGSIPIAALVGEERRRTIRLEEPRYALPMAGRGAELAEALAAIESARGGRSVLLTLVGEAGLGKSRLLVEIIRRGRRLGFEGYAGACRSDGRDAPWHPFRPLFEAFFGLEPKDPPAGQLALLESGLAALAPGRLPSLPLLAAFLHLPAADNDFTRQLDPARRKAALHLLLGDCLEAASRAKPLLVALEDSHWIDGQSRELLASLGGRLASSRVLFVTASRPAEGGDGKEAGEAAELRTAFAEARELRLGELSREEGEAVAVAAWATLFPGIPGPEGELLAAILDRAQGNPFYIEELLHFLRDRTEPGARVGGLAGAELPDSLQALVLQRIDRLTEREKVTLKVASVIGRVFPASWLPGYYPQVGSLDLVRGDLLTLQRLDLTPLERPEPELAYLFKHMTTREVAYEGLPFDLRARLHERLAAWLEAAYPASPPVEALAFHYGRGGDDAKKREWYRKAAEAAGKSYANRTAADWYTRLIELLEEEPAAAEAHNLRASYFEELGLSAEAESDYTAALALASGAGLAREAAAAERGLGVLAAQAGDKERSLALLDRAATGLSEAGDAKAAFGARLDAAWVLMRGGDFDASVARLDGILVDARKGGEALIEAKVLHYLGTIAHARGAYPEARDRLERSLAIKKGLGERLASGNTLNNLGVLEMDLGDFARARGFVEESLALQREIGDAWGIAAGVANLGTVALGLSDFGAALNYAEEAAASMLAMKDLQSACLPLTTVVSAAAGLGDLPRARAALARGAALLVGLDDEQGSGFMLAAGAGLFSASDDHAGAAAIAAASRAVLARGGFAVDAVSGRVLAAAEKAALGALGEKAMEVLRARGGGLDTKVALAEAAAAAAAAEAAAAAAGSATESAESEDPSRPGGPGPT